MKQDGLDSAACELANVIRVLPRCQVNLCGCRPEGRLLLYLTVRSATLDFTLFGVIGNPLGAPSSLSAMPLAFFIAVH